jgi:serine/threonine-protein kinase
MTAASADRNLLFGILALQLDFITRDQLVAAMHAWVLDKAKGLGDILVAHKALAADRRALLEALVAEHLKKHDNDPAKSLAALSSVEPAVRAEVGRLADGDVQASLAHVTVVGGPAPSGTIAGAPVPTFLPPTEPAARYRILRPHARGGLGEVFVAEDAELGRQVALKEIQERHSRNPVSRSRFTVEAEITGQLEHPGIVPVYGLGQYADGRPYYAMRFIRGDNLHSAIRRFHRPGAAAAAAYESLEFRQLLRRFVDVCNAIGYAHSRGVLHRDLKPGNIMLGQYGETLVVDWGLAKITGKAAELPATAAGSVSAAGTEMETTVRPRTGGDSSATVAGQALGTPAYMSPEQAAGRLHDLGPATDIYSLGATLYELLTGKLPFEGQLADVLGQIQRGEFPHPRSVNPAVPKPLEAICRKAMAVRPGERYTTAQDLGVDIEQWLADEPVTAWREPWTARARRWVRRHRTGVSVAAGLLGTALVASVLGLFAVERERRRTEEQRHIAEQRRAEAESARSLADDVIRKMTGRDALLMLVGQDRLVPPQVEFLKQAGQYYEKVAPPGRPAKDVQNETARFYALAAKILAKTRQYAEAEAAVRKTIAINARLADEFPAERFAADVAAGHYNLGYLLAEQRKFAEARLASDESVARYEKLLAAHPDDRKLRQDYVETCTNASDLMARTGQVAEAEELARRALAGQEQLLAADPTSLAARQGVGVMLTNLARIQARLKKSAEAEQALDRAAAGHAPLVAQNALDFKSAYQLAQVFDLQAEVFAAQNRLADAEAAHRRALGVWKNLGRFPRHRAELADCYRGLAAVLCAGKKVGDAADLAEDCAEVPGAGAIGPYQAGCIFALCAAADPAAAERHAARAVQALRDAVGRGFDRFAFFVEDSDLDPLRRRDDFAALLLDLSEGPAGA